MTGSYHRHLSISIEEKPLTFPRCKHGVIATISLSKWRLRLSET
jgi:hypothetical protein